MNNVRITIPEFEEAGLSYEETFRIMLITLKHKLHYLKEIHPSESIDDIRAYPLLIIKRIVKTTCTLHSVIERDKDYVVANMIIRSLADYISSFILIYDEEDQNQKILRHYLYIMDGFKVRIKYLSNNLVNDGRISESEHTALLRQITEAKSSYEAAYNLSINEIKAIPAYKGRMAVIDALIESTNWKFKTLGSSKNFYNWDAMHELLGFSKIPHFFSSLSDSVHGLSTSNLIIEDNPATFEPIYGISISLLGKLNEVLDVIFKEEMKLIHPKLISMLTDEGTPSHYVEYLLLNTSRI